MAADSAALNTIKNKVQDTNDDRKTIKFTKQEIENMPESINSFITISRCNVRVQNGK